MSLLTRCLIRRVVCSKPTIRHRRICDKNNSHGVARGLHLCACWYRATESLQPRGIGQHAIDNLRKKKRGIKGIFYIKRNNKFYKKDLKIIFAESIFIIAENEIFSPPHSQTYRCCGPPAVGH